MSIRRQALKTIDRAMSSRAFTEWIAPIMQQLPIGKIKKNIIKNKIESVQGSRVLSSSPYRAVINITNKCNYRCKICEIHFLHKKYPLHYPNTIDLREFKNMSPILENLYLLEFFGNVGEPLTNPDFKNIVKYVKTNFMSRTFLNTNGSLLNSCMASSLIEAQFDEVLVSLHAATEDSYSKLIGGNFKQVVDNIATLSAIKEQYGDKKPEVGIAFALNKINANETEKMVILTEKLKANYLQVSHYHHGKNAIEEDISFRSQPEMGNARVNSIYNFAKFLGGVRRKDISVLPKERPYLDAAEHGTAKQCYAPWNTIKLEGCIEHQNSHYVTVCNRIVLFRLDYTEFDFNDFHKKLWNHPYFQYMRATTNSEEFPNPVCQFCRNPENHTLRNTDNDEYRRRRDESMRSFWELADDYYKPQEIKGIYLIKENPYGDKSISPQQSCEACPVRDMGNRLTRRHK